jgi:hypothetical protein
MLDARNTDGIMSVFGTDRQDVARQALQFALDIWKGLDALNDELALASFLRHSSSASVFTWARLWLAGSRRGPRNPCNS